LFVTAEKLVNSLNDPEERNRLRKVMKAPKRRSSAVFYLRSKHMGL
jgi:hypothetical protein